MGAERAPGRPPPSSSGGRSAGETANVEAVVNELPEHVLRILGVRAVASLAASAEHADSSRLASLLE